jgi:hypothetical protein
MSFSSTRMASSSFSHLLVGAHLPRQGLLPILRQQLELLEELHRIIVLIVCQIGLRERSFHLERTALRWEIF